MQSLRASVAILATCLLPIQAQDPQPGRGGMFGSAVLARCADTDRDGTVKRAEWDALVLALRLAGDSFDVAALKARLLSVVLDTDGDGAATRAEVAALHQTADRNTDGIVQRNELVARGQGADLLAGFVRAILFRAADQDGDRGVTAAEWSSWVETLPASGAIPAATFAALAGKAEQTGPDPEDRPGAVTPGVFLLTIASDLDATGDGIVTAADLAQIQRTLDQNGDGDLAAAELRPARSPRAGGQRGGFGAVDLEARRALPPRMPWQRNLEDALALVAATGKPLLICVNMDGETACEALAWGRYRDPEFAALASGFICLIASPDRRNPADHDDRGRRLPDPRFGRVVNQEHIGIEPALYERYFRGNRVAPRHVGVAPDGKILFDIFLTAGLDPIDAALREHGKPEPKAAPAETLDEAQLLASPDAGNRDELERRFAAEDEATRARLAGASLSRERATQHPELLRIALHDRSPGVRHAGLQALAAHPTAATPDLLVIALGLAGGSPAQLAAASEAWSKAHQDDARGKAVARLARGLSQPSRLIDVAKLRAGALFAEPAPLPDLDALDERLAELDARLAAAPGDGALRLTLAETTLQFAFARQAAGRDPGFLFQDAQAAAQRALKDGAPAPRAHALLAWTSYLTSDFDAALRHAEAALPSLAVDAGPRLAAAVLDAFASCRLRALYAAMTGGDDWPAEWIADLRAAYSVLLALPECTEALANTALEWAATVEAHAAYRDFAEQAIARFPLAVAIQAHWRAAMLREGGAQGLLERYAGLQIPGVDAVTWQWYGALAAFVAAEQENINRNPGAALAAYTRAIQEFAQATDARPDFGDSSRHYIALGQAARARLLAEQGELDQARDAAIAGLLARPGTASQKDGLGRTPAEHAAFVRQALVRAGRDADAERITEAAREAGVTLPPSSGQR